MVLRTHPDDWSRDRRGVPHPGDGQLSRGQRRFLEPVMGRTVVIVELEEMPFPSLARRLWLSRAMICPDEVGLIMAVEDWLTFRTELDEAIFRHRRPPA